MTRRAKTKTKSEPMVSVRLPESLVDSCQVILDKQGSSVQDFLRLHLRAYKRSKVILRLQDKMTIGKYTGEVVETVVRTAPEYMDWLLSVCTSIAFAPEVSELVDSLNETTDDLDDGIPF